MIPPIKPKESFTYLGRHFDFEMSNNVHKEELLKKTKELLRSIDELPLHPKNKLLIYHRFVLSKLSWDLTITDISMTWVKQSRDSIANQFVRIWLEIPISGSLDIIQLAKGKFSIGYVLISTHFAQCQNTLRNTLKHSPNIDVRKIYDDTHTNKNLQYDKFKSTKEVIKNIREGKENLINKVLTTQGLVVKSIWEESMKSSATIWSKSIVKLQKNIYNFCIRYLNNSLANTTNLHKWGKIPSPMCLHCNNPQTLGHVVTGCVMALNEKRYNYRHDSILLNIIRSIESI